MFLYIFGILFGTGLFFLMSDILKLPKLSTRKTMLEAGKRNRKKTKNLEVLLYCWAVKLAPYISIDEYKRIRMKNVLEASGMNLTPEELMATAIIKSALTALLILPCLVVFPLLVPVPAIASIMLYFNEIQKPESGLKAKREKIEQELPRFVTTITQELKASRDVLSILEKYKKSSEQEFAKELDILTADMRSSSYEAALTRWEARINSAMLSDISRGLIGVLRGDDSAVYFQMLAHDMKQLELQGLKARAMKIPPKVRVFSFIMLMCFMLTYMGVIVFQIINSIDGLF